MESLTAKLITILVLLFHLQAFAEAQKLKPYAINIDKFTRNDDQWLQYVGNASVNNDALQLTPDTGSNDFETRNKSGRVLLKQPFRLWDGDVSGNNNSKVASFNSSFLINMHPFKTDTPGEGLAFVIVPDLLDMPPNSFGGYLGLTNATSDGNSSNKLIAVELDTYKQDFDPDANHIGLDINGVRSVINVSLTPYNLYITPDPAGSKAKFFNLWVQYDGFRKVMEVYIAQQAEKEGPTPPRPSSPILTYNNLDLRNHVNEYSYFGFSGSTGYNFSQLNCVLRWNLTINYLAEDKKPWAKIILAAGVPTLVVVLSVAAWLGYKVHKSRAARSHSDILGRLRSLPGTPREFQFGELKKATNNFDEKNKLGQGGFGVVYRGKLAAENSEIAVKWFSRESIKGRDDFLAELTIINRLRHKHLVRLLGWCHRNLKLLLVYEYMPNGSLDKHLFAESGEEPLNWNLRTKIISGVASALHYLHNEYDQKVVHRDLKASNIMLDADFNARLGDFGLARALENEKTSYAEAEGVLGTVGYIAPECFHTGKATQKSDVYAFGAVILETICGLRPGTRIDNYQCLVDWVWFMYREGRLLEAVDERLGDDYDAEDAERLLLLGLACSHPIASERPIAQDITQIMSGKFSAPDVPLVKPAFIWPAVPSFDLESGTVSTASKTNTSITTSHFNSGWSEQCLSRENYTGYTDHSMA